MKNLLDNIIDEMEDAGIKLLEERNDCLSYHQTYDEADRNKIREAISKAIAKSLAPEE